MTKKIEAALELSKAATVALRKSRREYNAALKSYTNLAAKLDSAEQYLLECSEKATKALADANKAAKAIESSTSVRAPKVPKSGVGAKVKPVAANTPSGKSTAGTKTVKPKAPATGVTTDKPTLTRAEKRRIAREAKALAAQQAGTATVKPKAVPKTKTAENQAKKAPTEKAQAAAKPRKTAENQANK